MLFVLFVTRDGLTRLGDSDFYVSAAQYHEAGLEMRNPDHGGVHDEFRYPSNGIYATWSPFFPWLLARLHQLGFTYDGAGRVINALSTAGSVVCILWLLRYCLLITQGVAVALFLTHPGIVLSYTYLMTESLAICLMLVCIVLLWQLDASWHSRYLRATRRFS